MSAPFTSEVHVPRPLSAEDRKKLDAVAKAAPSSLYVYRPVVNADEIIRWAKAQGFKTTLPAEDLHVTVTYSRAPVDWMAMGENWSGDGKGNYTVEPGGPRQVEVLGEKATVLLFASSMLCYRHEGMVEKGASWDFPEYQPHVTISYDAGDLDLTKVEPFKGKIVLGPEVFEPLDEEWRSGIVEKGDTVDGEGNFGTFCKVAGVNEDLGLVFGWAIVCKRNGEPYFDLNIDHDGRRVPEHITESAMLKGAAEFMQTDRVGNDMHRGPDSGSYVFAFPLTEEIAKAMNIETKTTGLMVAYKPEAHVLAKFKSGEYTGFSIEGARVKMEELS